MILPLGNILTAQWVKIRGRFVRSAYDTNRSSSESSAHARPFCVYFPLRWDRPFVLFVSQSDNQQQSIFKARAVPRPPSFVAPTLRHSFKTVYSYGFLTLTQNSVLNFLLYITMFFFLFFIQNVSWKFQLRNLVPLVFMSAYPVSRPAWVWVCGDPQRLPQYETRFHQIRLRSEIVIAGLERLLHSRGLTPVPLAIKVAHETVIAVHRRCTPWLTSAALYIKSWQSGSVSNYRHCSHGW
jgi:hypothetical protein